MSTQWKWEIDSRIRSDRQSAWWTMDRGLWHCIGDRDQDHPQGAKKCKKAKWLSEDALQIAVKRRESKSKGEKERYTHLNAEFQRIAGEIRKPSSVISVLEKEMATHSSVLAWRIPGTVEPSGLPFMGSHRVGHDWSDLAAAAGLSYLSFQGARSLKVCNYRPLHWC